MRETPNSAPLPIYSTVALAKDVEADGSLHKAGTRGQIVEVHDGGKAYEVELESPYRVVTLRPDDLDPA